MDRARPPADAVLEMVEGDVERVGLADGAGHRAAQLAEHGVGVGAFDEVGLDPRRVGDADLDAEMRHLRAQAVAERLDPALAAA